MENFELGHVMDILPKASSEQTTLLEKEIERLSSVPFYTQLADLIEEAINRGEYSVGDKIPSETDLCRNFDLARSTVRETLRTLEDRNLVRIVPRRGAFVTNPKPTGWVLQGADGFFEGEVKHDRRKVETKVLEAKLQELSGAAASALGLSDGDNGFVLHRLRKLDGQIALYSINYLLPEMQALILNSEVMQTRGSLNRVLKAHGYIVDGARRTVESVAASERMAKLLNLTEGAPLLLVTSVSWDKNKRAFDYYMSWVRTDVVKVTVVVSSS